MRGCRRPSRLNWRDQIPFILPAFALFYAAMSSLNLHSTPRAVQPALVAAATSERAARQLVWFVGLSHGINHFVMLIFPAVLLLVQQEFDLGYAALGLIANAGLLCYGAGALPAGVLADRLGGERILVLWLVGGSLACMATALAAGPVSLALGLALVGLFGSLHHPAGSGILVALRTMPAVNMARAFGLSGILGNAGLAASPLLAAAVGARWGWRTAFLVGAIPGLFLAFALLHHRASIGQSRTLGASVKRLDQIAYWRTLTLPLLILFGFEVLMGFVFQGFSTFLPAHLAGHAGALGLTETQVARGGSLASLALLFGGLGHFAAGRMMGFKHREAVFLIMVVITTACLLGMGIVSGLPLVLFSIVFAFSYFALGTISNTFVAALTPAHLGGTAFGVLFTLSFGVGSIASSMMGAVGGEFGLPAIFLALAAVSAGGIGLIMWLGRAALTQ
jgi:MFS family permease